MPGTLADVSRCAGKHPSTAPVALCHEWLSARWGSDQVFEEMARALPAAELYALTYDRRVPFDFGGREVRTTFLDAVPGLRARRPAQLPLMPLAWRLASRRHYDVVVTSSHACAKGFWPGRAALHLCYCFTPLRYVWHPTVDARRTQSPVASLARRALRRWDLGTLRWVDDFAVISSAVAARVERNYGRSARVIHPGADTDHFTPDRSTTRSDFALAVSRMVPYKRLDLAIRSCHLLACPLVLVGSGPEDRRLRELAASLGADVRFVGHATNAELRELYRRGRALVFPPEEDFGLVAVEAQACGMPVVALARGGALDTVVPGETGVLVAGQDPAAFAEGLAAALESGFDEVRCRQNAERFSRARFRDDFSDWVRSAAAARGIEV